MLDKLQRRNYATTTVQYYIQAVERFAKYFHRPRDDSYATSDRDVTDLRVNPAHHLFFDPRHGVR
jgi:hypothetical protein